MFNYGAKQIEFSSLEREKDLKIIEAVQTGKHTYHQNQRLKELLEGRMRMTHKLMHKCIAFCAEYGEKETWILQVGLSKAA